MFTRKELQELRERAIDESGVEGLNLGWSRAYLNLADAADHVDAMIARTEEGQEDKPQQTEQNKDIGAMDMTPTPPLSQVDG